MQQTFGFFGRWKFQDPNLRINCVVILKSNFNFNFEMRNKLIYRRSLRYIQSKVGGIGLGVGRE